MPHGSITTRSYNDHVPCGICGRPSTVDIAGDCERYVPLPRLKKFKTRIPMVVSLCDDCFDADCQFETAARARMEGRKG